MNAAAQSGMKAQSYPLPIPRAVPTRAFACRFLTAQESIDCQLQLNWDGNFSGFSQKSHEYLMLWQEKLRRNYGRKCE
jgi:hypothetical protein